MLVRLLLWCYPLCNNNNRDCLLAIGADDDKLDGMRRNNQDMKGGHNPAAQLSLADVLKIKSLNPRSRPMQVNPETGRPWTAIAVCRAYQVSAECIRRIWRGETWDWLQPEPELELVPPVGAEAEAVSDSLQRLLQRPGIAEALVKAPTPSADKLLEKLDGQGSASTKPSDTSDPTKR